MTKELVLHPQPETRPALKLHLLPRRQDSVDGNAAIFYLKAMGFLEQQGPRQQLDKFLRDGAAKAKREGRNAADAPPYTWLEMAPDELPIEEVKSYLKLLRFQEPILYEGWRRRSFDMNRQVATTEDPISILLPEIQAMRQLARTQSIRCRLAVAEGRVEDAIAIIGQQFAMARHLGQDDFLVSALVGIAISGIAWNDAFYLLQHADTPNLYWALTELPSPLVSPERSLSVERELFYFQLKPLREVGLEQRSPAYWRDFIQRFPRHVGSFASELGMSAPSDPEAARELAIAYVVAAYPGARRFLIEEMKLPVQQVDAYPTAQVVALAVVNLFEHWRDESFKWLLLPAWQVRNKVTQADVENAMKKSAERYGPSALPASVFLPAILAAQSASARNAQQIAMLRTVEGIRMYAAEHERQLPKTLDNLAVPAPIEPFTGKPMRYEYLENRAVLTGYPLPGLQYRLRLRIAD